MAGDAARFKYKNIFTADVLNFFNRYFNRDFSAIFEQYLYHASLPVLQVKFAQDEVRFKWKADIPEFDMPVKVRSNGKMHTIQPTTAWQSEPLAGATRDDWQVAIELFYIGIEEIDAKD